jgi:DNA-binding CsgD family transcriptional regulator/tetratricopeptide (TPR) repeat protein
MRRLGYPDGGGLLERAEQLALLDKALAAVADGGCGRTVLAVGEAGIGKTALLRRFSGKVAGSARVLWAACDHLFIPRPLGPFLDLAGAAGGRLAARMGGAARPYDVAAALLAEFGSGGTAVVVLEDVHWADEASLDVVRLLARRIEAVPTLLVLSYRDDELNRSHPLRLVLGDLSGGGQVARVELGGLSRSAVAVLARPQGLDAGELYARTGGNPFFVTEVLAAGTGRIPRTVRDAVLARAARLGPAASALLDAAAVIPGRAELWLLDKLVPAAAGSLDECLGSGMLRAGDGWVAFRHEIARLVVEESLLPGRRAALNRAALAALASPVSGPPDVARLAHHAEAAGDAEAVLTYAPAAAERATAAGARREAADLYARALRFAGGLEPADRAGLLKRFAGVAYFTGRGEEAAAALREAVEIHRARGDLLRQGVELRLLAKQLGQNGALAEARAAVTEAVTVLEQLPPGPELARTYNTMAAVLGIGDDDAAIRWGEQALELAKRVGCLDAVADTLNIVGTVELRQGNPDGLAKLDRSRALAQQAGDHLGVARAYTHCAAVLAARREWVLADRYIQPGLAFCREHGLDAHQGWLTTLAAEAALALGRWDEAVSTAAAILSWPAEGFPHSRVSTLVILARVQARRGEPGYWPPLDEAAAIAKAAPVGQVAPLVAAARAEAAWLQGAPAARIGEETGPVVESGLADARWWAGELEVWRHRAGLDGDDPAGLPEPYRLEITGDAHAAARWWQERGCAYDAALALAGTGDPAALRRALDILHELGARPAAAIMARRLRALGEKGVRRGPRPATTANPAGLTYRETEILRLLAAGLSNTEIAARLVLSGRTVDNHVSAILRKLGARTRSEAAAQTEMLGLGAADGDKHPQPDALPGQPRACHTTGPKSSGVERVVERIAWESPGFRCRGSTFVWHRCR